MADISIKGLHKTYPGSTELATNNVSLEVAEGEFMVLLGPSGCGKTTLLRMVAGLDFPDQGSISIGGRDVTYLPPQDRNLSMVFQSYAVFPHRNVRTNIAFGLMMKKVPREELERKVEWAADLLQLSPYLDRYPANLSGGQRQRVAVARAIVMDADVLLMDEPLSNLDALLRLDFRAELKKIVQQLGSTTLYVTHDQVEAMSLSDRVAVMKKGQIAQLGHPITVYEEPADRFVGGFIGSPPMNFLDGRITPQGGLEVGGQSIAAPEFLARAAARTGGTAVMVGIRAENISLEQRGAEGSLDAAVEVVEPLGHATLLTVDLGGQTVKVQVPSTARVSAGDTVGLRFEQSALRFFDTETQLGLTA
ncbi:ABC transporter ATP-binding protein [Arthrobacter sp. FX8]|jgi:multiple sugar transport system ATP-binding protein|uniref:ABC transporter ATP-binding protein n=1 Tax=unclassified Arthrobacter TaxID=235627 RepID=UPI0011A3197E|nr:MULTISPECIES: ABC transporter ATP-binding protein [unclassified Arthrobacter]TWD54870.1 carbohydrate ABC transporter ATP-binding protein (CUT1 family) [Arthrobacter sp. AG367]WAJ32458.1 ABC transporter ATP-binding protein [Arthrobacter sp. FX8]